MAGRSIGRKSRVRLWIASTAALRWRGKHDMRHCRVVNMFWRLLCHGTLLVGSQTTLCVRSGGEKIEIGERLKLRRGRGAVAYEGCSTSTLLGSEVNDKWAWASWWGWLSLWMKHVGVLHNTESMLLFQVVFHSGHCKLRLGRGICVDCNFVSIKCYGI